MLIVVTHDPAVIEWTRDPASNANAWSPVNQVTGGSQQDADRSLGDLLTKVGKNEPLCMAVSQRQVNNKVRKPKPQTSLANVQSISIQMAALFTREHLT